MSVRPAMLCKLTKGKIIDTQENFVDTFNWMVDFIDHLKGEGEVEPGKTLRVDRHVADQPVIRGAGGAEIEENQIVVSSVTWNGDYGAHPNTIEITRGRLALNDAGKIIINPDSTLTQYIETVAHSVEFDI